jgi:vitamin B12 transporter
VATWAKSMDVQSTTCDSLANRELHEVEVQAKTITTINTGLPAQKITAQDVAKLNVDNVADIAKYFAGVTVKDYGGAGGQKTVSFRGLNALHTGVSYDGVMMSDAQSGMIDLGKIGSENISEIAAYNGQPSNIFQPARMFAYSGVIAICTQLIDYDSLHTFHCRATAKVGSFGLYNGNLFLSKYITKKLSLTFNDDALSALNNYPFSYMDGQFTEKRIRTNSDIKSIRNEMNSSYHFDKFELVSIKLSQFYSDRGLPGAIIIGSPFAGFSNERFLENELFGQLHYENKKSCYVQYQFSGKISDNQLKYTDQNVEYYSIPDHMLTNFYRQNEYYLTGTLQLCPTNNLIASLASDWDYNTLNATSNGINTVIGTPERTSFLENIALKYMSQSLTLGANLLYTKIKNENQGTSQPDLDKITPGATISIKPLQEKELVIRAFYKNIFRVPTFSEIYYHEMFSSNLQPEKTNQYDLGVVYETEKIHTNTFVRVSVDVFYNNIKDKITIEPHGGFSSVSNIGEVEIEGVDISSLFSHSFSKNQQFNVQLNYTFQRAINVTQGDVTFGDQIPYTPLHSGAATADYVYKNFQCGYSAIYSGYRYSGQNSDYRNLLPTFVDQGVFVKYTHKMLALKCEVNNIFDVQYQIVQYYPMPGRNVKAILTLNL